MIPADLVFYNYILKCFFLIDLKMGKVSHKDVGQMDMYRRMFAARQPYVARRCL